MARILYTPPGTSVAMAIGGTVTGGTNNCVLFINPAATLAQDANFSYVQGTALFSVGDSSDGDHIVVAAPGTLTRVAKMGQSQGGYLSLGKQTTNFFGKFLNTGIANFMTLGDASLIFSNVANYTALKRVLTGMEIRVGDDSAYAKLALGILNTYGNAGLKTNNPQTNGSVLVASSTKVASIGGKLKEYFTDSGNVLGAETDLYSYSTEANLFSTNGDTIYFAYTVSIIGAAVPTKQVRIYFAGTLIFDTTALVFATNETLVLSCYGIRKDANTVRFTVTASFNTGVAIPKSTYTQVGGLTLTAANILKITGDSVGAGANSNDVTALEGYVKYQEVSQ